jgi:hypothetical protein
MAKQQIVLTSTPESIEAIQAFVTRFNIDVFITSLSNLNKCEDKINVHYVTAEDHITKVEGLIATYNRK